MSTSTPPTPTPTPAAAGAAAAPGASSGLSGSFTAFTSTVTSRLAALSTRSARYIEPVTRAAAPIARAGRVAAGAVPVPGRIVIGGAIGCLVLGFLLHWSELVFIGVTLAAALVIASVYAIGRTTYAVTVELNPRRVIVGGRALGRIAVTNSGQRPVFGSRIELPVGAAHAEFQLPRLAPGQEHEDLFAVPTHRRALILAGPATSVRGDQLGLLRRTQTWTERIELFVHPVTTRLKASAQGLVRDLEGQPTKTITNSDLAFHALRPYEQGDSMRNVHWRTSARTGQLMVRQYQETRRSQMLLVLGADAAHYATDEEFELAVSALASIGVHVIGEENQITAGWDGGALHTVSPVSLLDDSCRLEPVRRGAKPLREVVRTLARRRAQPSVVLLVVGSQAPAAELRSVATLFNHDTVFTAIRVDPAGEAVLRRSGPVTVATVASLRELPLMLQRLGTQQ